MIGDIEEQELDDMRQKADTYLAALKRATARETELLDRHGQDEKEVADLRMQLDQQERHGRQMATQLQVAVDELRQTIAQLQEELHQREQQINEYRLAHQAAAQRENTLVRERETMQALLEARRRELQDAQRYLATSAPVSESDVVRIVHNLNVEVFQTAAAIAESFHIDTKRETAVAEDVVARARGSIGASMVELLQSSHHGDAYLVQIALQVAMSNMAAQVISTWNVESDLVVHRLHEKMVASESQRVAGRWRSLTCWYSRETWSDGHDIVSECTHRFADSLLDILAIAGGDSNSSITPQSFFEDLDPIVRLAIDIRKVTTEDIVASDYAVLYIRPNEEFDQKTMQNEFNSAPSNANDYGRSQVWGTTALGLWRREKDDDSVDGAFKEKTSMKAVVVLEDLAEQL
ncbi:hypothetical protein A0H81_07265 [Grifola frondosa]|uniref:Uncharacterized protein n=1 Tax=Grifola frondosa TaxID=5627 RepID=A0A1C7M9G7_GRIFR|nr:hypothetical protein A0H81_07265 [Grifola frondosa]